MDSKTLGASHMVELLVATSNPGKLREFQSLLPAWVRVVGLRDVPVAMPAETGLTFAENARIKALAAADQTGMLACADDSGICVDALDGAPGIYSARYAGAGATDAANRAKLLGALEGVPEAARTARFVCVVALARGSELIAQTEGTCDGSVGFEERGEHGFGYDSVFVLPDRRTIAMLSATEKDAVSHRGQAVRMLMPHIARFAQDAQSSSSGGSAR